MRTVALTIAASSALLALTWLLMFQPAESRPCLAGSVESLFTACGARR